MAKIAGFLAALLFLCSAAHAETVLITGSNSGIGLEFAKQYAAKGWTVIATHRHDTTPDVLAALAKQYPNVDPERMDVTKVDEVKALAAKMQGKPIDVLINNAGLYVQGDWANHDDPRRHFPTLVFDDGFFDDIMDTNVRASALVTQTFLPNLRAGKQKKVISITSSFGTISKPESSLRAFWYGVSKAALNKVDVTMATVLKPEGIIVVPMHPGAVDVERQAENVAEARKRAIAAGLPATNNLLETPDSVRAMIQTIDGLTLADSGKFIAYDGSAMPW